MKQLILIVAVLGVVDPNCTLKDICTPGYTATVRPPASYTNKIKKRKLQELRLPRDPSLWELDHVIPLELCGAPRDPNNLNPEPWDQARRKDALESQFHRAVCAGTMDLKEAQKKIVTYE